MKLFRYLKASEIECRVERIAMYKDGQGAHDGLYLLLYKDARCDMNILDECVGPYFWQRDHKEHKGNIYCGIGIYTDTCGDPRWVWKWDCGAESNTEKEKGEASDSFKRAGFCWGIGRELYTAPEIFIPANLCDIKKNDKGKWVCYDTFTVSKIECAAGRIVYLVIKKGNEMVFTYGSAWDDLMPRQKLMRYCMEHEISMQGVAKDYHLDTSSTDSDYQEALEGVME